MSEALFWLAINLITLVIMAFFSSIEMACVSFNKVRLQYYISQGHQRAQWLHALLKDPSRLFGTTLVCVNLTMMVGSECARQFYSALGINPSYAAFTQILIVITFGELAPLLAARKSPENITMMGIPILYGTSKLIKPVLFILDSITKGIQYLLGKSTTEETLSFTREELQKILEEQTFESLSSKEEQDFNLIVSNIFNLRAKRAFDVMDPIDPSYLIPSHTTVGSIRKILDKRTLPFLLLYHKRKDNITGVAFPRDLIRHSDNRLAKSFCRPPWFITQESHVMQILEQFRENNQTLAIILNRQGKAVGVLTLEALIEEIFGEYEDEGIVASLPEKHIQQHVERTVAGDMKLIDFCKEFKIELEADEDETLSQKITKDLGHTPEEGESIVIEPYEITVIETGLLGAKFVRVKSKKG